jgi:2-polyprenyl-3-methyl-5-hydroxy-6-metoxy-1,4-benzoquinol methylase
LQLDKVHYLLAGFLMRKDCPKECPACHGSISHKIDQKWSYQLLSCDNCALLYRFPYESSSRMREFYQKDYKQSGLTTDLPSSIELQGLISTKFANTEKDYMSMIRLLRALGLKQGARVLDYGANWGYGIFQFNQAGFESIGYEISKPRADYAANLGVVVHTQQDEIIGPFDVVHSRHVLEHVPDPRASLKTQWGWVKPGGYLIAETPNGSVERREADSGGFHKQWGQVHPVLLTDEFVQRMFPNDAYYLASEANDEDVSRWDQRQTIIVSHNKGNFQFIIKKQIT